MLTEPVIRASWEVERAEIIRFLIDEKKFNPRAAPKAADNYIESMVCARLPNASRAGITAAWRAFKAS